MFYSVSNNGTIRFIGKKGSGSILYPISTNTQWGWILCYMNQDSYCCSSFRSPFVKSFLSFLFILSYFTFILYFILAYSTSVLNIINLNMININKVGKKDNMIKKMKPQSYVSTSKWNRELHSLFFSFHAYWRSKSTLSKSWRRRYILGWHIVRLVRYIGLYGISPFSPSIEISSVSLKKIDWIIKNL